MSNTRVVITHNNKFLEVQPTAAAAASQSPRLDGRLSFWVVL